MAISARKSMGTSYLMLLYMGLDARKAYTLLHAHSFANVLYLSIFASAQSDQHLCYWLSSKFLFVLLLYIPSQQLCSWWDSQFTLPHFFLGKLDFVCLFVFVEQAVNQ